MEKFWERLEGWRPDGGVWGPGASDWRGSRTGCRGEPWGPVHPESLLLKGALCVLWPRRARPPHGECHLCDQECCLLPLQAVTQSFSLPGLSLRNLQGKKAWGRGLQPKVGWAHMLYSLHRLSTSLMSGLSAEAVALRLHLAGTRGSWDLGGRKEEALRAVRKLSVLTLR